MSLVAAKQMVSKDEQRRTAVHEAGHAVVGWMLPWCDPVVKVSIIWRGNALGEKHATKTGWHLVKRPTLSSSFFLSTNCKV